MENNLILLGKEILKHVFYDDNNNLIKYSKWIYYIDFDCKSLYYRISIYYINDILEKEPMKYKIQKQFIIPKCINNINTYKLYIREQVYQTYKELVTYSNYNDIDIYLNKKISKWLNNIVQIIYTNYVR